MAPGKRVYPFTRQFVKVGDGATFPEVVFGPPAKGGLIHIKKVTASTDGGSSLDKTVLLFLDVGNGYHALEKFPYGQAGAVDQFRGIPASTFDFYLTEGMKIKVVYYEMSAGEIYVFNIVGEEIFDGILEDIPG